MPPCQAALSGPHESEDGECGASVWNQKLDLAEKGTLPPLKLAHLEV